MAERDRFRSDERWNRDDDWRREGSSYRSSDESRRGFGEGSEDYYRSRDFGSRGEYRRGDFGRSDYGRSGFGEGRGDFGRDYGRGRDFAGPYGDQSFGDYGRDFGRGHWGRSGDWGRGSDWNRPEASRWSGGDFWRDQRGNYGGLGYGGSPSGFGRYGEAFPSAREYGSRSFYGSDYGRDYDRGDFQRGREDDRGFIERATDAVSSWFGGGEGQRHYRGRGPKGYARSDDRIREDVSDRLGDDWLVDATEIEVMVLNGEVTLSGTVNSRDQRRRAEDIAESVSGVKHVQNNVRVSDTTTAGFGSTPGSTTSSGTSAGASATSRKTGTTS